MGLKNFIKKTTTTAKSTSKNITNKYELHVRKRAVKEVAKKLKTAGLSPSEIEINDYEVMVSDASKDIKSNYSKKVAQAGLSLLGLDLLFGI